MKTYTYDEVNVFIKELETGRDEIQNKISGLREKRKFLKLLDFKGKQEIDKEIEARWRIRSLFSVKKKQRQGMESAN